MSAPPGIANMTWTASRVSGSQIICAPVRWLGIQVCYYVLRITYCVSRRSMKILYAIRNTQYGLFQDGAITRVGHHLRVARQPAALVFGRRVLPAGLACRKLFVRYIDAELACAQVDIDDIAIADEADRAALGRLGRDMADAQATRAATKAPVGDQRCGGAQLGDALDHTGQRQHLAHARAAARAFVAYDNHVAVLYLAVHDRVGGGLLAVEHACRAAEGHLVLVDRADLDDRAFGRQVAEQRAQRAALRVRVRHRPDALVAAALGVRQVFAHSLAGHGHCVELQHAGFLGQLGQNALHAAGLVDILDMPLALAVP